MTVKVDTYGLTVQAAKPGTNQQLTIGGVSQVSLPCFVGSVGNYVQDGPNVGNPVVPNTTQHVRLCATSDCYIVIGPNPVAAVGGGLLLPAMTAEYFWISPGDRIAVIQLTAAGSLNIVECVS
jgi:hypothetical protein